MRRGSLVCVGSGIKSVAHLTLEAKGWIEQADLVVYCVADPATEIWIKRHARESFDLYVLYGNDKRRLDTYNEMVEVMTRNVRAGKDVCAVFYGHPGIFVLPTHRAISQLRADGYRATMLPAISALDCLFADIGVDPAQCGCQTVEATDLLLRRRTIQTDQHVVIWQIGCVGDLGFRFAGYDNRNLGELVDYLCDAYSAEQPAIHYQASQFPVSSSIVEHVRLGELADANVTGISTLYIPPAIRRETVPEMAERLGLRLRSARGSVPPPAASPTPALPKEQRVPAGPHTPAPGSAANGGRGNGTGDGGSERPGALRDVPIKPYTPSKQRSALADYIAELATNPRALAEFNRNPELAARLYAPNMTDDEHAALVSRHAGRIRVALRSEDWRLRALDAVHVALEPAPARYDGSLRRDAGQQSGRQDA